MSFKKKEIIVDAGKFQPELLEKLFAGHKEKIAISTRRLETVSYFLDEGGYDVFLINPKMDMPSLRRLYSGDIKLKNFDEKIFHEILNDEKTFLLYERNSDPKMKRKSFMEKTYEIRLIFEYAAEIIESINPKVYLFLETPHSLYHWVFAKYAEQRGIEIYYLMTGLFPWNRGIISGLGRVGNLYKTDHKNKPKEEAFNEYIKMKRGTFLEALPYYESRRRPQKTGTLQVLNKIIRSHTNRNRKYLVKALINYFWHTRFVSNHDFKEEYAVFFLHYQPERTTLPDGWGFTQQILAIRLLRNLMPKKVKLLVKEHPSTFFSPYKPNVRSRTFYNQLQKLDGVYLIDFESDQYELIEGSNFVATITGTVGFEATMRNKPCVIFGGGPYLFHDVDTIHNFSSSEKLTDFIETLGRFKEEDFSNDINSIIGVERQFLFSGYDGLNDFIYDETSYQDWDKEASFRAIASFLGIS